ncbi:SDR family oxidoreductase [Aestuariibacter salexigens]|uniref:SDR family oxidoreductase n=1 Tax=Aestuariibacter salexigens TaxID=226010 RepID=UPI000421638F|nr:SDR family oxidoreductase [Aestuariibacter salexigens]
MNYFVTGITGFIGRQFLEVLRKREGTIYALVRPNSVKKLEKIRFEYGIADDKLVAVPGDLSEPLCGVNPEDIGHIDHFYHLGAIYDLTADQEQQKKANVEGTQNALNLAEKCSVKCFHHVSSIVAAGFYPGVFTEEMFDEAVDVEKNPYFETKHISEGLVRKQSAVPWRIYRPAVVVGNSETGWINKIDGPYYFFELINTISEVLPRWVPLPVYRGNEFNIVPVDFIAKALDHISHEPGLNGTCFHLTNPKSSPFGAVINTFLKAAKGPTMKLDLPADRLMDFLPIGARMFLQNKAIVNRVKTQVLENLGIPKEVLLTEHLNTRYDCRNTLKALEGSGISVPPLKAYAARLWNYWEQHLNPEYLKPQYLSDVVRGRIVMITGGSDGIGLEAAKMCAEAGAKVLLVARTQEKLDVAVKEITDAGGSAVAYACDLADMNACDALIDKVLAEQGYVDILINNAGRSIRRSLNLTYERFHDFERVMQLNYFSAVKLTMRLLPSMVERKRGHVVNISTIAAMGKGSPRFSSYTASKSALDSWANSAALEYAGDNIAFTNIHMPLVRTKMIAATTSYQDINVLSTKEAVKLINDAIVYQPSEVNTMTGTIVRQLGILSPKLNKLIFSTLYQITDDSEAAKASAHPSAEQNKKVVATKAMDALQQLHLDKETLEAINNILRGYHT